MAGDHLALTRGGRRRDLTNPIREKNHVEPPEQPRHAQESRDAPPSELAVRLWSC